MNSEFLPVFVRNALADARRLLPSLEKSQVAQAQALEFCSHLRHAGIGTLFMTATPEVLHLRLKQSGEAFAWFLRGANEHAKQTGAARPFFDAVAAGDMEVAREVAKHARRTPAHGEEYEEDFLFIEFLMQRYLLGAESAACERLLARHEHVLQGAEDTRLPLCRALLVRDAEMFDDALTQFLQEREDAFEANAAGEPPERLATEGLFSVEGMALIRLAMLEGIPVAENHLHVPGVALEGSAPISGKDTWRHLD
ncbi:Imm49 family immunity protein [Myxococcus xanthus]|uniref:Imm49 family immunity protein n=1 Tax=Myxococcus xanthus TaxID=34 RepID=UPI0011649085|nr:Imm49 family immunity protein [Myxococcus xanthus]QDF06534.1 hypothetical protein BHS04_25545 [Myxococcus xanthus]